MENLENMPRPEIVLVADTVAKEKEIELNGSNSNKNNIHTSNLSFGKEDISNAETSANPNNIQLNNEETTLNK